MSMFDARELAQLQTDLGRVVPATVAAIAAAADSSGESLRDTWKANAVATSGEHGKHYPNAITSERQFLTGFGTIGVEVGPDSSKKQGGMGRGFEYGSRNQPPHMDGHKAADVEEPKWLDAVGRAAEVGMDGI